MRVLDADGQETVRELIGATISAQSDIEVSGDAATNQKTVKKSAKRHLRILVADDQEAVRKRICATLAARSDFEVCGEAANGREAVEKAKALNPDLVVLDITMPLMNGLEAARAIRSFSPDTPIVILSVHKSKQLIEEARRIGVRGYVTKEEAVQNLILVADAVLQKQTFFPS